MKVFETLEKLGLTSLESAFLFKIGTRDQPELKIYRDKESGVIFIKDKYFSENECSDTVFFEPKMDFMRKVDNDRRVNDLSPFIIGKDIADFGCEHGDFIRSTRNMCKSVLGIELQNDLIIKLNQNGIRCENSLENIDRKSVDTCFFFHSFEHLEDPIAILNSTKQILRNTGRIVIEVPSASDFLISFLKEKSFIEHTLWSQHLILHTSYSLRRFLEYAGYKNIIVKGCQRYSISNHIKWITQHTPGGHQSELAFLETQELHNAYSNALIAAGLSDSLIAIAEVL